MQRSSLKITFKNLNKARLIWTQHRVTVETENLETEQTAVADLTGTAQEAVSQKAVAGKNKDSDC